MQNKILGSIVFVASSVLGTLTYAVEESAYISEEQAIENALGALDVEVLGIRFYEPDTQWDVFIRTKDHAYEIEVNAKSGEIVAVEKESLDEIQSELSGNLSHEGVDGDTD